jgi:fructokinase
MRIGVDLGGSKIEAIALDAAGSEHFRERVPTPNDDYRAILQAIAGLVERAERSIGQRASVGVGTPGALSLHSGLLKNSNTLCLNGKPLLADLEQVLARPVKIANDANCFALSEAIDGAGRRARVVFGVILGTGVGGGIVIAGEPLSGCNAIAGEWGHNPLPWPSPDELPGPACYCGKHGCIETFLSGPGLSASLAKTTGINLSANEIATRASSGDAACGDALSLYEERLARALAHVINVLDPDVIVLGGGLSNVQRWYAGVPQIWGKYVFSDGVSTRLERAAHGDSGGVRGAAWLWSDVRSNSI